MDEGLFGNPILCKWAACHKPIEYHQAERRWLHSGTRMSRCLTTVQDTWAAPGDDTICPSCDKPMPAEWCWDGQPSCPLGMPPRYPVGDQTARAASRELQYQDTPAEPRNYLPGQAHTRRGDPQTSFDAAASWSTEKLSLTKQRVLLLLKERPQTHEEMYDSWLHHVASDGWPRLKEQSVRSRCSELKDDHGLVEDSGITRKMRDGRDAVVWRLAP